MWPRGQTETSPTLWGGALNHFSGTSEDWIFIPLASALPHLDLLPSSASCINVPPVSTSSILTPLSQRKSLLSGLPVPLQAWGLDHSDLTPPAEICLHFKARNKINLNILNKLICRHQLCVSAGVWLCCGGQRFLCEWSPTDRASETPGIVS